MEVVVTTGAVSRAKLQSNHHHQQTNTQFLQAAASLVIQQCQRIFMNFRIDSFTPKFSKIYRLRSLLNDHKEQKAFANIIFPNF